MAGGGWWVGGPPPRPEKWRGSVWNGRMHVRKRRAENRKQVQIPFFGPLPNPRPRCCGAVAASECPPQGAPTHPRAHHPSAAGPKKTPNLSFSGNPKVATLWRLPLWPNVSMEAVPGGVQKPRTPSSVVFLAKWSDKTILNSGPKRHAFSLSSQPKTAYVHGIAKSVQHPVFPSGRPPQY